MGWVRTTQLISWSEQFAYPYVKGKPHALCKPNKGFSWNFKSDNRPRVFFSRMLKEKQPEYLAKSDFLQSHPPQAFFPETKLCAPFQLPSRKLWKEPCKLVLWMEGLQKSFFQNAPSWFVPNIHLEVFVQNLAPRHCTCQVAAVARLTPSCCRPGELRNTTPRSCNRSSGTSCLGDRMPVMKASSLVGTTGNLTILLKKFISIFSRFSDFTSLWASHFSHLESWPCKQWNALWNHDTKGLSFDHSWTTIKSPVLHSRPEQWPKPWWLRNHGGSILLEKDDNKTCDRHD